MSEAEDTYSPTEAARVLGVSDRRVRQLLEAGELEGEQDGSGRWHTPQRAVHAMLEERGSPRSSARRAPDVGNAEISGPGRGQGGARSAREPDEDLLDLVSRVEDLSYRLGASQARLELTERAESTLREQLERERERAEQAERRARELEERLAGAEAPRQDASEVGAEHRVEAPQDRPADSQGGPPAQQERRPWWRRIFG